MRRARFLPGMGWAGGGRYGWEVGRFTLRKSGTGGWEALDNGRPIMRAATLDSLAETLAAAIRSGTLTFD